jgi:hypothetical protein
MQNKQSAKAPTPAVKPAVTAPDRLTHDDDADEQGEGSYQGTRDYQAGVKSYLENADVEKDARDAAPADADEARELEKAEDKGRAPAVKVSRRPKTR